METKKNIPNMTVCIDDEGIEKKCVLIHDQNDYDFFKLKYGYNVHNYRVGIMYNNTYFLVPFVFIKSYDHFLKFIKFRREFGDEENYFLFFVF